MDEMTFIDDVPSRTAVQPASTVSTTLLKAEGARVVLFGFDTGEELTEHTAAMPVLLQVLSGSLDVSAGGRTVTLRPDGLIHLTSRLPHSVVAQEPTIMQLTMLDPRAT